MGWRVEFQLWGGGFKSFTSGSYLHQQHKICHTRDRIHTTIRVKLVIQRSAVDSRRGWGRVCQRSDMGEHQKSPASSITCPLLTAGSSQRSAGLSFTHSSFRTAGGRWDPRHLLHRAGNMLRRQGHTSLTSQAGVMWTAAVAHLERLRTHLCSTAAANTLWLRREVQGPPGVLPAELVIHSGQVPRPWEQVVRRASRDVVSCQRRQRRHGQVT